MRRAQKRRRQSVLDRYQRVDIPRARLPIFSSRAIPIRYRKCWIWRGGTFDRDGYGMFWDREMKRGSCYAHRFMFALYTYGHLIEGEITVQKLFDMIPIDMDVHHLCRNRACGNPLHLELQPAPVNRYWLRMWARKRARIAAMNANIRRAERRKAA